MENTRIHKIERLLQKDLGDIFLLQTKMMPGVLVSISAVRVSPDLGLARVFLSVFPSEKAKDIMQAVKENTKAIRYDLGKKVRLQLRKIPQLVFQLDDSLDYLENIDNLLKK
ncbi:ribosome-binding factor A [Bacteroidales bacterium]|nr:ribosome-binding factor A [Bacteroidales bacterium]